MWLISACSFKSELNDVISYYKDDNIYYLVSRCIRNARPNSPLYERLSTMRITICES